MPYSYAKVQIKIHKKQIITLFNVKNKNEKISLPVIKVMVIKVIKDSGGTEYIYSIIFNIIL